MGRWKPTARSVILAERCDGSGSEGLRTSDESHGRQTGVVRQTGKLAGG
jgi:hypothetical protein